MHTLNESELTELTTVALQDLWKRVLGDPPMIQQFELWACTHSAEVIKHGIMKCPLKNLQMGGTMSQDHRVRFASKVMQTKTHDPQKAQSAWTLLEAYI